MQEHAKISREIQILTEYSIMAMNINSLNYSGQFFLSVFRNFKNIIAYMKWFYS